MGTDYLRLECVRASFDDVREALVRRVQAQGWELDTAATSSSETRTIALVPAGAWVVVDEHVYASPPVWAEAISKELACTGISARSWSDYGEVTIERYEAGESTSALRLNVEEGPATLDGALLADLAPPAKRAALGKGRRVRVGEADEALVSVFRRAGLPEPIDRYTQLDTYGAEPIELVFGKPKAAFGSEAVDWLDALVPEATKVGFRTAFHVRGTRRQLIEALAAVYHRHDHMSALRTGAVPTRRIFLVYEGDFCSFGELFERRPLTPLEIHWGLELSELLPQPVLRISQSDAASIVEVFSGGVSRARVPLAAEAEPAFDASFLDGVAPAPLGRVDLPAGHAAKLQLLAARLGLEHVVLRGSPVGTVLPFVPRP